MAEFKNLPSQARSKGVPPLSSAVQPPGTANINPSLSLKKQMPGATQAPPMARLPLQIGSPGRSAQAPGQLKKKLGLRNASSIARNKGEDQKESRMDVLKGVARRMSTMPQPTVKFKKSRRLPSAADRDPGSKGEY